MNEYTVTMMMRFVRVVLKLCLSLLEIGISNDAVQEILEILAKDIVRVLKEREV